METDTQALLEPEPRDMATLAARLGTSPEAAAAWLRQLAARGAPVCVADGRAWRAERIERRPGAPLGAEVRWFRVVGSTQDVLRTWADAGAPHGAVVVARQQTAGRGRQGRTWVSPPDSGVYLSVLLRRVPLVHSGLLPLAAGLAVADALGIGQLKWPNDVLAPDGRKLAGVLAESDVVDVAHARVRLGVGVNFRRAGLPPEAAALEEWAAPPTPERWFDALLEHLARRLDRLASPAPLLDAWRARAAWLGEIVEVRQGPQVWRGAFLDVDPSGALLLRGVDGIVRRFVAGDLHLRRVP